MFCRFDVLAKEIPQPESDFRAPEHLGILEDGKNFFRIKDEGSAVANVTIDPMDCRGTGKEGDER